MQNSVHGSFRSRAGSMPAVDSVKDYSELVAGRPERERRRRHRLYPEQVEIGAYIVAKIIEFLLI